MKVCFESTSGPSEKARFVESLITKYKEIQARVSLSIFTLKTLCYSKSTEAKRPGTRLKHNSVLYTLVTATVFLIVMMICILNM
jgi:hypothetical protein